MTPPREITEPVPTVYTTEEAAAILRVKPNWLEKKAAARRIPFSLLGGSYHFLPQHLWRIIAEFEQGPSALTFSAAAEPASTPRRRKRQSAETAVPRIVPLRPRPPRSARQNRLAA